VSGRIASAIAVIQNQGTTLEKVAVMVLVVPVLGSGLTSVGRRGSRH
jgi:hypothetical protein